MEKENIVKIVKKQKEFFYFGETLDLQTRSTCLKKLRQSLIKYEKEMFDAVRKDMGRSEVETYFTETRLNLKEIDYTLKNIKS